MLPPFLRGNIMIAWLSALSKPIEQLYVSFMSYRAATMIKVSYNSQVIYLEKLLNDTYNSGGTLPIYIYDTANTQVEYLANKAEGYQSPYIYNKSEPDTGSWYIGNKSEYNAQYDFIIMVPATLYATLLLDGSTGLLNMTALVNFYRLAGKRFTIQSY